MKLGGTMERGKREAAIPFELGQVELGSAIELGSCKKGAVLELHKVENSSAVEPGELEPDGVGERGVLERDVTGKRGVDKAQGRIRRFPGKIYRSWKDDTRQVTGFLLRFGLSNPFEDAHVESGLFLFAPRGFWGRLVLLGLHGQMKRTPRCSINFHELILADLELAIRP